MGDSNMGDARLVADDGEDGDSFAGAFDILEKVGTVIIAAHDDDPNG
jgi:hypothetical protein